MRLPIIGFSKLSRQEHIDLLKDKSYLSDQEISDLVMLTQDFGKTSKLSENVISSFELPYSLAPNFLIDDKEYFIPMVTEESSVVAAAAKAAKFWYDRGGYESKVISNIKVGTIYIKTNDGISDEVREEMISISSEYIKTITQSMINRGGGLIDVQLDSLVNLDNIFKLRFRFDTVDSMGANFINTTLEQTKSHLENIFSEIDVIAAILSNHCPDAIVESVLSCPVDQLTYSPDVDPKEFSSRFKLLVDIANSDLDRATTHNKGIMNGLDSIMMATGNDFRAVEAGLHSYLMDNNILTPSYIDLSEGIFRYSLKMPIVLGTVGGVTDYHPKAIVSRKIMNQPSSLELMKIACSVGLASNFAAISALITTGIQEGHIKLHHKKKQE